MATIEKFEELEVWKTSINLCADIYKLTNTELFAKDYGLKDQIRRASVSVPSNISEGYERDSKKQFLYFLVIAKGLGYNLIRVWEHELQDELFEETKERLRRELR